jgi:hypothetical protein
VVLRRRPDARELERITRIVLAYGQSVLDRHAERMARHDERMARLEADYDELMARTEEDDVPGDDAGS